MANQVFIVGHKNPDNDSIAAAVSYAYLKNALEAKKAEPEAEYVGKFDIVVFALYPHVLLEWLEKYGPCPIHRRSFISKWL